MSHRCCGTVLQEIVLARSSSTAPGVVLQRCSRCGDREYTRGGQVLSPEEAFEALAGTFRRTDSSMQVQPDRPPVAGEARPARGAASSPDRASEGTAERAELRKALRAQQQAAAAAAAKEQVATVDVTDLADLLAGWTVHGAVR